MYLKNDAEFVKPLQRTLKNVTNKNGNTFEVNPYSEQLDHGNQSIYHSKAIWSIFHSICSMRKLWIRRDDNKTKSEIEAWKKKIICFLVVYFRMKKNKKRVSITSSSSFHVVDFNRNSDRNINGKYVSRKGEQSNEIRVVK